MNRQYYTEILHIKQEDSLQQKKTWFFTLRIKTSYVCMYACMDEWMDGWMDGSMDRWMDGWIDGSMDGWIDGWIDGWMDGWIDGKPSICCRQKYLK